MDEMYVTRNSFGNRTIGYVLGTLGGLAGGAYTAMSQEETDMTYVFMGALIGRAIGEGLELLVAVNENKERW